MAEKGIGMGVKVSGSSERSEVYVVGFNVSVWDITKFMLKCIPATIIYSVIVFGLMLLFGVGLAAVGLVGSGSQAQGVAEAETLGAGLWKMIGDSIGVAGSGTTGS